MPPTPTAGPLTPLAAPTGASAQVAGQIAAANKLVAGINQTVSQAKTTQPTVLTSQNINTKNQQNVQQATTATTTPKGGTTDEQGIVRDPTGAWAEAPSGAVQITDQATGQNLWQDQKTGLKYATGPAGYSPETQGYLDKMNSLKMQMDATGAANIENIKQMYAGLIAQQQQVNKGAEAGVSSLLIRGGSSQTASSSGILQTQIGWGLQQISDLTAKENSAVIGAQQAMEQNDMQMLDKMMTVAQQARTERQAAADKIAEAVTQAQVQMNKDTQIGSMLSQGITDPTKMLQTLKDQGITGITSKDITDTLANLRPDAKAVADLMTTAANNGAPANVLQAIGKTGTLNDAYSAAGKWGAGGTGVIGEYNQARAQGYNGSLMDYQSASAYRDAYARASASVAAQVATEGSPKIQNQLEQQGRQVILKELSNRSGGLGLQDAKVNQSIHLTSLLDQYKTTKTVPNVGSAGQGLPGTHEETTYNIPPAQYAELAIGLASLVAPGGTTAESDRQAILSHTAKGDISGAIQYITGSPQPGSTTAIIKNLADSIDRQGTVAEQERQTYLNNMQSILPTSLSPDRRDALIKGSSLNSYTTYKQTGAMTGDLSTMTPEQIDTQAYTKIQTWAQDPKNAALLSDLGKQFPNMSNIDLAQKLGLMPSAQ